MLFTSHSGGVPGCFFYTPLLLLLKEAVSRDFFNTVCFFTELNRISIVVNRLKQFCKYSISISAFAKIVEFNFFIFFNNGSLVTKKHSKSLTIIVKNCFFSLYLSKILQYILQSIHSRRLINM